MKNILFSLLILSSSLIYSVNFKSNVTKKEEVQVLDEQKIFSLSDDDEEMDFLLKEKILNDIIAKQRFSSNGWKVAKGLVGLWFGIKFFFCGSIGVFFSIIPDPSTSQSSATLSPIEKFLTNRFLWLSLSSTLTIFSLWLLKKSATNLYQGLYGIEDTIGSFEKNL